MVTRQDIANYAKSLVGKKVTVPTNPYGGQCASLIDHIVQHFTTKNMSYTNAIDGLTKAKQNGFAVTMDGPGKAPRQGDVYVINTGDQFGHIGICIEDSDGTGIVGVEQNVDGYHDDNHNGINDQLEVGGGGTTKLMRNDWYSDGSLYRQGTNVRVGKVVGWFSIPTTGQPETKGGTMPLTIKKQIRDTPQVGVTPYRQVHAHSTGNPNSTAQNEADFMSRKDLSSGFYTHVVGNGQIIQVAPTNRGAWDVGGGWNYETYAAVELIESHKSKDEFMTDYKLYVNLLRQLAKEGGLPTTLDTGDSGIIAHAYASAHQPDNHSDHVDPYPYLAKWGISKEQFAKDLSTGFGTAQSTETTNKQEDNDMFTISAPGRGIALMTGGRFYALLDANDPQVFWAKGVPHMQVSAKTFDNFQGSAEKSSLDDETVNKLIKGLK